MILQFVGTREPPFLWIREVPCCLVKLEGAFERAVHLLRLASQVPVIDDSSLSNFGVFGIDQSELHSYVQLCHKL